MSVQHVLRSYLLAAGCLGLLIGFTLPAVATDSAFYPLPQSKVDPAMKNRAQQVIADLLTAWRDGKFEGLPDDFSLDLMSALPPSDQKKAYDAIRVLFGHFISLTFAEALVSPKYPDAVMFRFKGTFSATDDHPEIRVLMSNEGQVVGFWVRHWLDEVH